MLSRWRTCIYYTRAPCSLTTLLSTSSHSRDQGLVGTDGVIFLSKMPVHNFFSGSGLFLFCTSKRKRGCDWSSQKESRTFSLGSPFGVLCMYSFFRNRGAVIQHQRYQHQYQHHPMSALISPFLILFLSLPCQL